MVVVTVKSKGGQEPSNAAGTQSKGGRTRKSAASPVMQTNHPSSQVAALRPVEGLTDSRRFKFRSFSSFSSPLDAVRRLREATHVQVAQKGSIRRREALSARWSVCRPRAGNRRPDQARGRVIAPIVPEFIGVTHSRFTTVVIFNEVYCTEDMVGHKLGEFSLTRMFRGHTNKKEGSGRSEQRLTLSAPEKQSCPTTLHIASLESPPARLALSRIRFVAFRRTGSDVAGVLQASWCLVPQGDPEECDRQCEEQDADIAQLCVSRVWVDAGPTIKRFQPKDRGRAHPINKRTSHLHVEVAESEQGDVG